jgi:uncharacterized membrane protein YGL010W
MSLAELLQWQWDGYSRYHRSRPNLLIHVVAVPLFLVGNVGLVVALFRGSITLAGLCLVCVAVSVAVQGRGHKMEEIPPQPFTGLANAVARIFLEQWITFPRFVLSGGWARALLPTAP